MSETSSPPLVCTALHVRFNGVSHSGVCNPQRTLLENIEAMGLPIRSACRRGLCGSCRVLLETGTLHPTQHKLLDGHVLSCSSHLAGDASVVVDYQQKGLS